jgi:hypothetical protein
LRASKLRRALLRYYFTNPSPRITCGGILNTYPANLSRELGRLERDGLRKPGFDQIAKYSRGRHEEAGIRKQGRGIGAPR